MARPLDYLNPAAMGIGLLGALFDSGGGDMRPEQREIFEMLKGQIDPKLLERMFRRRKEAVGQEFAGLSSSTASRLRRRNAPVAKIEEVMDKLNVRRFGALEDVRGGIDKYKSDILGQLGGYASRMGPEPMYGMGYGELLGQGLGGLQEQFAQADFWEKMEKFNTKSGRAAGPRSLGVLPG